MSPGVLLALSATVAVVAVTPGPAVAAIVSRALSDGPRPALAISAGVLTGDLVFLVLAAAGVAAAAQAAGPWFDLLKLAGAVYLGWQGTALLLRRPRPIDASTDARNARFWPNFTAGVVLMLGHVQAMLFYAALLPAVVDPTVLDPRDLALVAVVIVVVIGGVNSAYVLLAGRARRLLASDRARRHVDVAAGLLMLAAAMLVATR
jgi:threonine/homoserine/homoserine lactone efflux protein